MTRFIVRVIIAALGLWIVTLILPGVQISTAGTSGLANGSEGLAAVFAFLFIGLIFGVINAFVKPFVQIISLPVTIVTLGLFTLIINALMLWLTAWLSDYTPVHFTIDRFFFTAVWAAIIISIVSMIGNAVTGVNKPRRDSRPE